MNIAFTKIRKIGDRPFEFNFRKLPGTDEQFSADVTDMRGNRVFFSMRRDSSAEWHSTGNSVPQWITSNESLLGEAIEEGMSEIERV